MKKRLGYAILALVVIGSIALVGVTQLHGQNAPQYSADVVRALSGGDITGFARAYAVRDFVFPKDHGAHPDFQTEWWYNTANVATADGRRFGLKFTIFRRALAPTEAARSSEWATNQLFFSDFAIADIGANQFYPFERFSRGAAGLAGAATDPQVHIWIENWSITAEGDTTAGAFPTFHLKAAEGPIAMDVRAKQIKPVVLEGDRGLSAKSPEPGNASYYYSLTRLALEGTITVNGTAYPVSGTSWMDREWSTSVLSGDAVGWDWFALQLDDGREIMLYQIRKKDGTTEITSDGTFVNKDGTSIRLKQANGDYQIIAVDTWRSPHTGAQYPSGWKLTIQAPDGPMQLEVTPLMRDQEINSTTAYWEGASRITGTQNGKALAGYAYVELTGYNTQANATPAPYGRQ